MYCINCGKKLNDSDKFCSTCGAKVILRDDSKYSLESKATPNLLCVIAIILFTFCPFLFNSIANWNPIFESFTAFCPMSGLAILIYVRLRYPNNRIAKILLILFSILFILFLLFIIFILVSCFISCSQVDWEHFG